MSLEIVGFEKRKFKAVIFDMDGTLYDQKTQSEVFADIRIQLANCLLRIWDINPSGVQVSKMVENYLGTVKRMRDDFPGAFMEYFGTMEEYLAIAENYESRRQHLRPDPELKETLFQMSRVAKLAILTSASESSTFGACERLLGSDWRTLFFEVSCIDSPGAKTRKPDPAAFLEVLQKLKCSPEEAVMVGDSGKADMLPAAMLGMLTVQVERTDAIPDVRIGNIHDLKNILKL